MSIYRGSGGAGDANNDITINYIANKVTEVDADATAAAASASAAAASASDAAASETAAATSESNASASASAAATSASASATSASASSTSATASAGSATSSAASATAAANSATAADASEAKAQEWASSTDFVADGEFSYWSAKTAANAAKTFASHPEDSQYSVQTGPLVGISGYSALHYAAKADDSATSASGSATAAAGSATAASNSATSAATSATSASDSATSASNSATSASGSATAAASSATNAATSETNAQTYATAFLNSEAYNITSTDTSNWDTAYGWGNHASAGYLTTYTETDPVFTAWDKSTGISITESQISDFGSYASIDDATALAIALG